MHMDGDHNRSYSPEYLNQHTVAICGVIPVPDDVEEQDGADDNANGITNRGDINNPVAAKNATAQESNVLRISSVSFRQEGNNAIVVTLTAHTEGVIFDRMCNF